MSRSLVLILSLFVLLIFLPFPIILDRVSVKATNDYSVHNLDTGLNYTTIQEAIDANETKDGHTIFVGQGIYYENVVVRKGVSLVGENNGSITVIDGNWSGTVLHLKSNNTRIEGFTLQNGYYGVSMAPWTHGHIVRDNLIVDNEYGIAGHYDVADVNISGNTIISNNITGIDMLFSDSVISNNLISDNGKGEFQEYSSGIQITCGVNSQIIYCINNIIFGNTIRDNRVGIWAIRYSEENLFVHNNFIDNEEQISASSITWNNNMTENYWSDYKGADTDDDGLGDIPYSVDETIQDNSPLMGIFSSFKTSIGYDVDIVSNSTIDSFQYSQDNDTIRMYVSNMTENQTNGFCRLTIPHEVLPPPYNIAINNDPVTYTPIFESQTLSIIYFSYAHSTLEIVIITETPSLLITVLFLMTITLTVMLFKSRLRKRDLLSKSTNRRF